LKTKFTNNYLFCRYEINHHRVHIPKQNWHLFLFKMVTYSWWKGTAGWSKDKSDFGWKRRSDYYSVCPEWVL